MLRGEKISVPERIKDRASRLIKIIEEDSGIDCPTDVPGLDEWRTEPEDGEWREGSKARERMVNPEKIVGTDGINVDRFLPNRLLKALRLIGNEEYHQKPEYPPNLNYYPEKDEYYVGADGNHRAIAFKALGLDEIYAEVVPHQLGSD